MATEKKPSGAPAPQALGRALGLALLAWLVPGAGHAAAGKRVKGAIFFALVAIAVVVGCQLGGRLYSPVAGQPLSVLGTFASMGSGFGYLLLRFVLDYGGDVYSRGYEYGTAFLVTAGLMNWLAVMDVWDRARGYASRGEPRAGTETPGKEKAT